MDSKALKVGWASTKPGVNKYHFYGADGLPLCAYQRQPGGLHYDDGTRLVPDEACSACGHPRHDATRKALLRPAGAAAAAPAGPVKGGRALVLRGRYAGRHVVLHAPDPTHAGFWWCGLLTAAPDGMERREVLLCAGQLVPGKEVADG